MWNGAQFVSSQSPQCNVYSNSQWVRYGGDERSSSTYYTEYATYNNSRHISSTSSMSNGAPHVPSWGDTNQSLQLPLDQLSNEDLRERYNKLQDKILDIPYLMNMMLNPAQKSSPSKTLREYMMEYVAKGEALLASLQIPSYLNQEDKECEEELGSYNEVLEGDLHEDLAYSPKEEEEPTLSLATSLDKIKEEMLDDLEDMEIEEENVIESTDFESTQIEEMRLRHCIEKTLKEYLEVLDDEEQLPLHQEEEFVAIFPLIPKALEANLWEQQSSNSKTKVREQKQMRLEWMVLATPMVFDNG